MLLTITERMLPRKFRLFIVNKNLLSFRNDAQYENIIQSNLSLITEINLKAEIKNRRAQYCF